MWKYNEMVKPDELYHYGVPGMKWGQRKAIKLQNRIDKINSREDKYRDKILNARSKNRAKIALKYDKKIEKAKAKGDQRLVDVRKENQKAKIKDFDDGTKYMSKALDIGRKNKTTILELKKKAINDPSIKETESYKKAKRWAKSQKLSEIYYGKPYTALMEAHYVAINNGKSWTRGNIK